MSKFVKLMCFPAYATTEKQSKPRYRMINIDQIGWFSDSEPSGLMTHLFMANGTELICHEEKNHLQDLLELSVASKKVCNSPLEDEEE